jgi:Histidine kinase-, DNA gyrase B-, and HSP90-like ATPase
LGCAFFISTCFQVSKSEGVNETCGRDAEIADVPVHVVGDFGRSRQIIVNLAGNAIKFTQSGEVVLAVKIEPCDGTCSTSRCAIPVSESHGKIFPEYFGRSNRPTIRRLVYLAGPGLGITISSRLVELMQGRIWVESDLGVGSKFHFTVKFEKSDEVADREPDLDIAVLRNKRALVIDDNATNGGPGAGGERASGFGGRTDSSDRPVKFVTDQRAVGIGPLWRQSEVIAKGGRHVPGGVDIVAGHN